MPKSFTQQLKPLVVYSGLRRFRDLTRSGTPLYDGIYPNINLLHDCPDDPFSHPNWLAYIKERVEQRALGVAGQNMHEISMSLLASMITRADSTEKPAVIDLGGGVGMSWTVMRAQDLADSVNRFIVFDNEQNCLLGRQIFREKK